MAKTRMPAGLGAGGRALWRSVTDVHEQLDGMQVVQLTEACRMKDRCDKLDAVLRGDAETWMTLEPVEGEGEYRVQVAGALSKANETANAMKQLLAACRFPDSATGARPQQRPPRGAQKPSQPGGASESGKVSSFERAQQRAAERAASAGG